MPSLRSLVAVPALALTAVFAQVPDAAACGGYFAPTQSPEVASHRMAFSVSTTQTTLWDQVEYTGDPASFAWVLPIKGMVDVGVSSDLLFEQLDSLTAVLVTAPDPCPCQDEGGDGSGGGGGGGGGVTVIAQSAVGPYDTVQLSSSDPTALTDWLTMNGYDIPASVEPTIAAYVNEGFDFLALKLAPGMGVSAMQPVRVTTPGAGLSLPLRMVAAGVGSTVPITLWVLAEGRYAPTNFPTFTVDPTRDCLGLLGRHEQLHDAAAAGLRRDDGQGLAGRGDRAHGGGGHLEPDHRGRADRPDGERLRRLDGQQRAPERPGGFSTCSSPASTRTRSR